MLRLWPDACLQVHLDIKPENILLTQDRRAKYVKHRKRRSNSIGLGGSAVAHLPQPHDLKTANPREPPLLTPGSQGRVVYRKAVEFD